MAKSSPNRIGKYSIVRQLGDGATSNVYLGMRDESLAVVAVKKFKKVFHSDVHKKMFLTEVELGKKMQHKNIVHVMEAHLSERTGAYLVMEFAKGVSLDQHDDGNKLLPIKTVLSVVEQIANALRYAAGLGIVHRDVKPANIILMPDGTAKLTDFGCAVPTEELGSAVAGSLAYMSPEQLEGQPLDQRADIYALGAVMYRLFTGKNSFEADTPFDARIAVLNFPITPIATYRKDFPQALADVIERAMKKNPAERYADWDEFIRDFGAAAHAIRMSDDDGDVQRGFSMSTQSALSNYLATDQYSRSVFSRSVLSNSSGT
ncbi:MAG: serine/threonine protein kinase [Nitrosomonadales bacterium]|nr:serine/threonine protein kinase [Nitrosomonadales bacterium]